MRLLQVLNQEKLVIREAVELVRLDPAFGAEILKLANSAAYNFRAQIDSISHAIVLLGTDRVKSLIMTVALGNYARRAFRDEALKACWHHSLATAFLGGELARACGVNEDRTYTAGLLRDIGRLALLAAYPAEYSNLIVVANDNCIDMPTVERAMFDIDQREAGRWLAQEWKFPVELIQTIAAPEEDEDPTLNLLFLIRLSSQLADTLGFTAIKPLRPMTFDQIQRKLPPLAAASLPEEAELREKIRIKVSAISG